jgi:hypothetical protein
VTRNEFMATFYGPRNQRNRELMLAGEGILMFAGIPFTRLGWSGFVNALGDNYGLDVRNFTCEAVFMDALAARIRL